MPLPRQRRGGHPRVITAGSPVLPLLSFVISDSGATTATAPHLHHGVNAAIPFLQPLPVAVAPSPRLLAPRGVHACDGDTRVHHAAGH